MKTENTLENKAKFFALHWGQSIKTSEKHKKSKLKPLEINAHSIQYCDEGSFLELKPLESISDEDAKYLGFPDNISATTTYIKSIGVELKDADWLRSKGYVLPFLNLSVQNLIDYGWIKLTEQ